MLLLLEYVLLRTPCCYIMTLALMQAKKTCIVLPWKEKSRDPFVKY